MARISLKRATFLSVIILVLSAVASAQNAAEITVTADKQPDSPIFLSILSVDSTAGSFHVITYSIQNVSKQDIRGYVVSDDRGGATTTYSRSFPPGKTQLMDTREEDVNLRNDRNLRYFVDLVVFADGSTWGKDERKRLDDIRGVFAGQDTALSRFRSQLEKYTDADLALWLANDKNGEDATPVKPDGNNATWAKAYERGYRQSFSMLRRAFEGGGINAVREKLRSDEK